MQNQFLTIFFSQLGHYLPGLILDIVGISLSIFSHRKNPQKFLLTTISFSIFFLSSLASQFFYAWTTSQLFDHRLSVYQIGYSNQLFEFISTPIWLTAWVILLVVIFNQKNNSADNNLEKSANEASNSS
jgi:hypothetical protein